MENSALTKDIVGKYASQSQIPSDGGLAVTLGETQEIFGRGVLRIHTHGPRHAYFMTFLPEPGSQELGVAADLHLQALEPENPVLTRGLRDIELVDPIIPKGNTCKASDQIQ
jgi:hypothetical protein